MLGFSNEYLVLLIGFLIAFLGFRFRKKKNETEEETISRIIGKTKYEPYTRFIICQSKHETGNFESFLSKEKFNLFGMGVPVYRESFRVDEYRAGNGEIFSVYPDYVSSVKDYISWLNYTRFPLGLETIEEFAEEIQRRNYATDPNYEMKLINICND